MFSNRIIVITGADHGLGFSLVKAFLNDNATVFAGRYMRTEKELERLAAEFPKRLQVMDMDVSSDESVKKACDTIKSFTNKLDILINNAAILGDMHKTIDTELDFEEMKAVFNTNALGALRVSNGLLPLLKNGPTKLIVNISSEAGSIGTSKRKGWFGYCMSKSAVNMQTVLMHNHVFKDNCQVMAVEPGHMRTYMRGKLDTSGKYSPDEAARNIISLIQRRAEFFCEKAAYINESGNYLPW